MRVLPLCALVIFASIDAAAQAALAPTGTLRAAYLANNPAQAVKDPATGALRGTAVDMARELARRLGVEVALSGLPSPQSIIDAVEKGQADIGFVAFNPERAGPVEFSQPYMLVQQTFLVRADSAIRSVKDIDRTDQRIGAGKGDSIALYLGRTLKSAQLIEIAEAPADALERVAAGRLDAFGANRQRLTDLMKSVSGLRLLADDLYGVEQTIIVPKGKPEALMSVNRFIEDTRGSGFLRAAMDRSGIIGIAVAPGAGK